MRRLRRVAFLVVGVAACTPKPPPTPPAPAVAPPPTPPAAAPPPEHPVAPPRDTTLPAGARHHTTDVRLAFVGDINLGTATLPNGVPPDSGRAFLAAAKPALVGDLVIGNFEGVLADSGETEKCGKKRVVVWHGVTPGADTGLAAKGLAAKGRGAEGARPRRTVGLSGAAPSPSREPREPRTQRAPRAGHPKKAPPPPIRCYAFLTPTLLAPRLAEAGFTHLNLANNHANDFGMDGRRSTETTLTGLGIQTYGPLDRIVIDTVRRGDAMTIVGVIGFTTYPFAYDLLDIPRSVAVVDSVRRLVDVLVVTFHGGAEGAAALRVPFAAESLGREPRGDLRAWAHAVVDAGADAMVGHGPHVLRGLEFWNGKPIAYSLGNFATYRGFNLAGPQALTVVLQLEVAGDGKLARARLVPMRQLPLQGPAPDAEAGALHLVRQLSEDDFGPTAARIADDGAIAPP
jgi:hypothetical protein